MKKIYLIIGLMFFCGLSFAQNKFKAYFTKHYEEFTQDPINMVI